MKISSVIFSCFVGLFIYRYTSKYIQRNINPINNVYVQRKKITSNNIDFLIKKLRSNDKNLIPKKYLESNGKVTYKYIINDGDKKLNLKEIKELINNPPQNIKEKVFLKKSVIALNKLGINIFLEKPKIIGATAEWDHKEKTIRFNPRTIEFGTKAFAGAMNHEIIHIIQSCKGGGVRNKPVLIGLPIKEKNKIDDRLSDHIYGDISKNQYGLELEAYSYQNNFVLSSSLFKKYCT